MQGVKCSVSHFLHALMQSARKYRHVSTPSDGVAHLARHDPQRLRSNAKHYTEAFNP